MGKKIVILGTAHGVNVSGKCSPDKRFREYKYSRDVIKQLKAELESQGFMVFVDIESDEVPSKQSVELAERCSIVNKLCREYGAGNCVYVSVHVNAAGCDGKWRSAGGWCAYTSRGRTKADTLATKLYEAAQVCLNDYANSMIEGKKTGIYDSKQKSFRTDYSDGDADLERNFYVLAHTLCPAVLTENLFQDNKADVAFLESAKGRMAIVELHRKGIVSYFE
mgnify:CR=1 FL=1